ncbi:MAG: DUF5110 domain-containing protein [Bacteroidaceae bacterium]|nr:DUF5110 domain-containing protein [Bacteroidaceae bacterium]
MNHRLLSLVWAMLSASLLSAQVITFYTPQTVRIQKAADTEAPKKTYDFVVKAKPEAVKVKTTTKGDITTYSSSALTVTVNTRSHQVSFAKPNGDLLVSEGGMALTPITEGPDKGSYRVRQSWALAADEPLYGVGLLQNGKMSQRGEKRLMTQSNLEDFANVFQSQKGYGIYWDNYSPTELDSREDLTLESQVGEGVDYYFMYGGSADGVIRELRHLTGQAPMLPLWTYGFHQSRERYKTQAELLEVVQNYRDLCVPFDGIIQDWQYWGSNYNWNAMEFLNEEFQGAQRMIDDVHKKYNAHMSISIWASFGPYTKGYKQMDEKGYLMAFETWPQSGLPFWPPRMDYPSGVRVYAPYSTEARKIYWENLSRLHKMGIDAWWMDSTDPDHHSFKDSDLDEVITTSDGKRGSYRSVRNAFPLATVEGVYDNQRAVDTDKRVFILTRSYFAGQQRTGANTWSGDIGSSWESLRKQVPICLNYTLTGNPQVNTDIGGFFAGSYNTQGHNSATRNPQFQELYVRWMQFGALCPMMRSHGTDVYRELYYYGKPGEPVYDALVSALRLRYRLLPYIYSTSWQVSKNDDSFMRALVMDFPQDKKVWDMNSEYMFGRSLLSVPVTHPLYTEEKIVRTNEMSGWDKNENSGEKRNGYPAVDWTQPRTYEAYLPAGTEWYDYWTGQRLAGGQTIQATIPLDYSPLYVRAGSILPIGPDVQYAAEKPWNDLEIIVYPGNNGNFTLYEDEGDNYNYERGFYTEIPMTWNDRSHTLTILPRKGQYSGMLQSRQFRVHTPNGDVKTVSYTGKKVSVKL